VGPRKIRKRHSLLEECIKFGTVRGIRSAASHFWTLDLLHNQAERFTLGFKDRPILVDECSPTDQAAYTFFTEGMRRRLGDHPQPSAVLTGAHMVRWLDNNYHQLFRTANTDAERKILSKAANVHLSSYLGWLRGVETFGLQWQDIGLIQPQAGPTVGLPPGMGLVLLELLQQTKSSQLAKVDVPIAFTTASELSFGTWLNHLRDLSTEEELAPTAFVFVHDDGSPWSSHYYRHRFLYPALAVCKAEGDPFLSTMDNTPGNTIPERFWSFNTQRRSGRSEVSKKRRWTLQAATPAEVVEHGRWRISRGSLDMPLAYLEWSIPDRACITILCT
jgi:hypothetical protein